MRYFYDKPQGFTVVELVVAIVVLGLMTTVILSSLGGVYTDSITSFGRTVQDTDTQTSLRMVEQELSGFAEFKASVLTTAPLGQANGTSWSYLGQGTNPDHRVLIVGVNAATESVASDTDNNRLPVFLVPGHGDCTNIASLAPARVTYVYFVAQASGVSAVGGTKYNLYRRTILPPAATTYCNGAQPWQKQTCAVGASDPSALCEGVDALLLEDVATFKVDYYTTSNNTTADVSSSDTIDRSVMVEGASSAVMSVTTNRRLQGDVVLSTATIRITRD